jgi:hypothetical protein
MLGLFVLPWLFSAMKLIQKFVNWVKKKPLDFYDGSLRRRNNTIPYYKVIQDYGVMQSGPAVHHSTKTLIALHKKRPDNHPAFFIRFVNELFFDKFLNDKSLLCI